MGFSIETITREDQADPLPGIVADLNERIKAMEKTNPNGFLDEFEARFESICADLACERGWTLDFKPNTVVFNVSGVKLRRKEE